MPIHLRTFALLVSLSVAASSIVVMAQSDQGRVTGRVTDGSGGALPGVTVIFQGPGNARPVSVTSDGVGQYQTPGLPPGTYAITFELTGFETRTNPTVVVRAGEVFVLDRQLGLAALTETVQVTGSAPAPPPEPEPEVPPAPLPPLRARPTTVPVPKAALASVCGPARPDEADVTVAHIVGHRYDSHRELYSQGDVLVIDVGADMGMAKGQNYVVRRRFRTGDKTAPLKFATFGEQSAGLVQIVETTPEAAVAVVVYACGEVMAGDALESFDALPVVRAQGGGQPKFDDPARIVFGELGRVMGTAQQLMVIDRGTMQDVVRGQAVTIFRRSAGAGGPVVPIGDGVVVVVRPQSATIQITRASEPVEIGTLIALHR
jgi:hypothetical protein